MNLPFHDASTANHQHAFAVQVGVLTEEIGAGVEAARQGNFALPEKGHTVLLGWGGRSVTVVREVSEGGQV